MQRKLFLTLLCHRAATPRTRNGSQLTEQRADINNLKRIHRLAPWLLRGLCRVPHEESIRQLNLFSVKHKRLRAFKISKGVIDLNPSASSARIKPFSTFSLFASWNIGAGCRHPLSFHPQYFCIKVFSLKTCLICAPFSQHILRLYYNPNILWFLYSRTH